jgi:hypothetical protein
MNKEEQVLLESFENGEWVRVANPPAEIKRHQDYARNTLKKDKRVNIRLLQYLSSAQYVDNAEMDEILQDKELVRNLNAGLKELRNGEYTLV